MEIQTTPHLRAPCSPSFTLNGAGPLNEALLDAAAAAAAAALKALTVIKAAI